MRPQHDLTWRSPTVDDAEAIGRMHHQAWIDAYSDLLAHEWFDHWTVDDSVAKWRRILTPPTPRDETGLPGIRRVRGR